MLVATKTHRYAGKLMRPGDKYEPQGEVHRRLMVAIGNAKDAPAEAPAPRKAPGRPRKGIYDTRALVADVPEALETKSEAAAEEPAQLLDADDASDE